MWQLFLPFRPPNGLPSGYKCEARGSVYPYRPFASLPSLPPSPPLRPSAAIHRRRCSFACRCRAPFSDNHGGQELDPSRGHVGSLLGDREEAGGVGPRWASAAKGEPDPARMEGATIRPPGAGTPWRATWLASWLSTRGGSECRRATSCGRSSTTTRWSYTISPLTPSRRLPFLQRSTRDTWGWSHTGIYGHLPVIVRGLVPSPVERRKVTLVDCLCH
jgi:hypothetical protein